MRKTLEILLKSLVVIAVSAWMVLIITDYYRYKEDKPMLIVLKRTVKNYSDGHVYVYYGLGYKEIIYERTSLYGKEFGHIFIKIKDEIPKK